MNRNSVAGGPGPGRDLPASCLEFTACSLGRIAPDSAWLCILVRGQGGLVCVAVQSEKFQGAAAVGLPCLPLLEDHPGPPCRGGVTGGGTCVPLAC